MIFIPHLLQRMCCCYYSQKEMLSSQKKEIPEFPNYTGPNSFFTTTFHFSDCQIWLSTALSVWPTCLYPTESILPASIAGFLLVSICTFMIPVYTVLPSLISCRTILLKSLQCLTSLLWLLWLITLCPVDRFLKSKIHITKFIILTILKYTIWWLLIYSQCMQLPYFYQPLPLKKPYCTD